MAIQARRSRVYVEVSETTGAGKGVEVRLALFHAVERVFVRVNTERIIRKRCTSDKQRPVDVQVVATAFTRPPADKVDCTEVDVRTLRRCWSLLRLNLMPPYRICILDRDRPNAQ